MLVLKVRVHLQDQHLLFLLPGMLSLKDLQGWLLPSFQFFSPSLYSFPSAPITKSHKLDLVVLGLEIRNEGVGRVSSFGGL